MAEDDIYNSKLRYEFLKANIERYLEKPQGIRRFQIQHEGNVHYFKRYFLKMDAQDGSYIRRIRVARVLLIICNYINKDLREATRDDLDELMLQAHQHNKTPMTKKCFVRDVKYLWRLLLPDKDEYGREDENIIPYTVRHLYYNMDKSSEKVRKDRLTNEEYERLVASFADDKRMQALITLSHESLGRPQEILGRKIKDLELHDNYAKVTISEHGKEGIGLLRCIDSYYYLSQWYNQHPLKHDQEAPLFINTGRRNKYKQFKPSAANKILKERCKDIGINKPITLYSLKRNGVTHCRLRGDSDVDIQHRARWTSTKQLQTYDLSHQEDSFKIELEKRGLITSTKKEGIKRTTTCSFCNTNNPTTETTCHTCKRPLNRKHIEKQNEKTATENQHLRKEIEKMKETIQHFTQREKERQPYDELMNHIIKTPAFTQLIENYKKLTA